MTASYKAVRLCPKLTGVALSCVLSFVGRLVISMSDRISIGRDGDRSAASLRNSPIHGREEVLEYYHRPHPGV